MPSEQLPDSEDQLAFAFARTVEILVRDELLTRVAIASNASAHRTSVGEEGLFMYKGFSVVLFMFAYTLVVMHSNAGARADKSVKTVEDVPRILVAALNEVATAMEREQKKLDRARMSANNIHYDITGSSTGTYTSSYYNINAGTWNAV